MVQNTKEILIWVGLVAAVSAGAAGLLGSGVISSAQTESLEIAEASFKKTGSVDGILTVAVKNAGTSQITGLTVTINGVDLTSVNVNEFAGANQFTGPGLTTNSSGTISDQDLSFPDTTQAVNAGQTRYYSLTVPGTTAVSIGESFTITVSGTIGTNPIVTSGVVTVTGF